MVDKNKSKSIFSVCSGILDFKIWIDWKYRDLLCVMCKLSEEDFNHFISCKAHVNDPLEISWQEIFGYNVNHPNKSPKDVKSRHILRKDKLEEDHLAPILAPMLHTSVEQL